MECGQRAALLIGHPGHELHVHAWLGRTRPVVSVLTDGGGRREQSRLSWTTHVLERCQARTCAPYGRYSDTEIYTAVLDGDHDLFLSLIEELAQTLVRQQITCLMCDPADAYNPTHDLCRLLAGAAVMLAGRRTGRWIAGHEFLPAWQAQTLEGAAPRGLVRLELSARELAEKLAVAQGYLPLRSEVETALERTGEDALRREYFRPFATPLGLESAGQSVPFYEQQGELRVAAGHYSRVLRYQQHMVPLIERVRRHVEAVALPETGSLNGRALRAEVGASAKP
jgi:hypothetical protein